MSRIKEHIHNNMDIYESTNINKKNMYEPVGINA